MRDPLTGFSIISSYGIYYYIQVFLCLFLTKTWQVVMKSDFGRFRFDRQRVFEVLINLLPRDCLLPEKSEH